MASCLIGLGANLHDRSAALQRAGELIGQHPQITLVRASRQVETPAAAGQAAQPDYLNAALLLETSLAPRPLWEFLFQVEARLGRRPAARWSPRAIDVDLLLYDDAVLETESLQVPHPRMAYRRFVLTTAAEIAGPMLHPTTGWTVAQLLARLDTADDYLAVAGAPGTGKTALVRRVTAADTALRMIADPVPAPNTGWIEPTGQVLATEIEFVGRRSAVLRGGGPGTAGGGFAVSDFWFDQAVAYARLHLAADALPQFEAVWQEARGEILQAKLLVLLDAPLAWLRPRVAGPQQAWLNTWFDKLRQELLRQASLPRQQPLLKLDASDPAWAETELVAAIQAMQ